MASPVELVLACAVDDFVVAAEGVEGTRGRPPATAAAAVVAAAE